MIFDQAPNMIVDITVIPMPGWEGKLSLFLTAKRAFIYPHESKFGYSRLCPFFVAE
jgi:hypothetical protein